MELDCIPAALGELLPDLDCSQQWQTSSSFGFLEDLSMDLSGASGASSSWVGCDLLLEGAEEEYSSKLLPQGFGLPQPAPTAIDYACQHFQAHPSAIHPSPASALHTGTSQDSSPAASAYSAPSIHSSSGRSRSPSPGVDFDAAAGAIAAEAAVPEPDLSDPEAVRLVGLALRLAQGDVNAAMASLLTWSAAAHAQAAH